MVQLDDAAGYDDAAYISSTDLFGEVFFVMPGGGVDGSVRERG